MLLSPITILATLDRLLGYLEKYILTVMLLVMLFLSFLQVILRNFFNTGIGWADVSVRYMVLWIGLLGASLATKDDRHLRIDVLNKVISKRFLPLVEFVVSLCCIVVAALLYWAAYQFVLTEKMGGKTLFGGVLPGWYFLTIMPIGFAAITLRYFVKLVELLYKFSGRKMAQAPTELDLSFKIKLK